MCEGKFGTERQMAEKDSQLDTHSYRRNAMGTQKITKGSLQTDVAHVENTLNGWWGLFYLTQKRKKEWQNPVAPQKIFFYTSNKRIL